MNKCETTEPLPAADAGFSSVRLLPVRLGAGEPVLPFDTSSRRIVEQYRIIRTKLRHHPTKPQVVAVSSAGSGDGKSVTAINIASAMALTAGSRILLVDCDLRRSSVAGLLGLPPGPGLTDVLVNRCEPDAAIIRIEQLSNWFVLPAGTPSANPPELLDTQRWRWLCQTFRSRFDYVILDTPPFGAVADSELIEVVSDGTIMVVRPDHTCRSALKKALSSIPHHRLLGIVLNYVDDWFLWRIRNGAQSGYGYYDAAEINPQQLSRDARRHAKPVQQEAGR